MKKRHAINIEELKTIVPDIAITGNPDGWVLLCRVSSEELRFVKSTRACKAGDGCLVKVTTKIINPDESFAISEALTFVPGAIILHDKNNGARLG